MLRYTGIGKYIRNLVENLAKLDRANRYILFGKASDAEICKLEEKNFHWQAVNLPLFSVKEQLLLPGEIQKKRLDIFHTPHFNLPLFSPVKRVVTIHDLIPLIFPRLYASPPARTYYRFMNAQVARRTTKVITDSENTRRDFLKFFRLPKERIEVIYGTLSERFRPVSDSKSLEEVKKKYGIGKKFLLSVGPHRPHKNLVMLVKVMALLKERGEIDIQLVITGKKEGRFPQVEDVIGELNLRKEVLTLGSVSDEELVYLYNGASVFLFPSLYEGFGFPPLEAMACGTPVISSYISSLSEVLGSAALLANPYDSREWAGKIREILASRDLKKSLRKKGLEKAKEFSSLASARATLRVYESLAN
jgi:glycosyltransferase involved in cell wall biosynthesis